MFVVCRQRLNVIYLAKGSQYGQGEKAAKKVTKKAVKKKVVKGTWTAEDLKVLKKLFANNPTAMVAEELGRDLDPVKRKASRLGMKKTKKYMKSIGRG